MIEPPTIDHDPDEPPRDKTGNGIYWFWAIALPVMWAGNIAFNNVDWSSVAAGALTGGVFVLFIIAYTGDRVPKWMRR